MSRWSRSKYLHHATALGTSRGVDLVDLTIVNASSRVLLGNMAKGAASEQAEIFRGFVERLRNAGADVAVVTSLSRHFCIRELENASPLPIFNALPALDRHFERLGVSRVGLLGTRTVMQSRLYGGISSAEIVMPQGADLDTVHDTYIAMAMAVSATDEQRELLVGMGEKLCREQGADAVALAGTELFLAFDGVACGYSVIDCAHVHIKDIVSRAVTKASE